MSKSKPTRCTCGARTKCPTIAPVVRHYLPAPGRGDPAEHWASLVSHDAAERLYGKETAMALYIAAKLWLRDGATGPWHQRYWDAWEQREPAYLLVLAPTPPHRPEREESAPAEPRKA